MNDGNPSAGFRPVGFVMIAGLTAALVTLLVMRPMPDADAAAEQPSDDAATTSAAADAGSNDAAGTPGPGEPDAGKTDASKTDAAAPAEAAPPPEPIAEQRPLRVTALGWELVGPGVIANDGLAAGEASKFRTAGLAVEFSVVAAPGELAAKLARGGGVADGADVALVPLPTFVASYEQLRALSPEVFFVFGWSQGRDALAAEQPALLTDGKLDERKAKLELVGAAGQPATMLALFALDQAGVAPARVELVAAASEQANKAPVRAIERSLLSAPTEVDARELILTSADAPQLIPMVAVAPSGFVHSNPQDLARFVEVWLLGVEQLRADVPGAARHIAAQQGAPQAVGLLEMMGYVSFAELADAVRLAGLSGRGAISLEVLFQRNWALWRGVGVLSTPAPEHAPLDNSVIARVALGEGAPVVLGQTQPRRGGDRLVLVHRIADAAKLDEDALVDEIGFLAGSFARADIELSVRKDKQASRRLVAAAIERYDLDPNHVRVGPRIRGSEHVNVRVLTP